MLTKFPPPPPKIARPQAGAFISPKPAPKRWDEVLRSVGYPDDVVVVDFETWFGEENKGLSTIEYIMAPSFEVLSLATTLMSGKAPFADYEQHTQFVAGEAEVVRHIAWLQSVYGYNFERCTVVIQNAKFDASILARRYNIFAPFVIDILGLSRYLNSRQRHGLEYLCKQFGLKEKGGTSQFKEATFRTRFKKPEGRGNKMPVQIPKISDELLGKLRDYNVNDNCREWELFTRMLPALSNPKIELRLMMHTLELFTKPTLRCDFEHGENLVRQMDQRMADSIPAGMTQDDISGNTSFEAAMTTALERAGDHAQRYFKPCKGKAEYKLAEAKDDPERGQLLNHTDAQVRSLMQARVAVKSWPLHIARVKGIMAQARAMNGLMPIALKYHGAHTGRWSGDENLNPQNLPKQGDELLIAVRGLFVAPEGHTLVIVDTSQIEARAVAWLAGQWDLVEKFKNGQEIYCDFASKVLGIPVRKPRKLGGIPAIEHRMAWARNAVGKVGILGCGYGMGGNKAEGYAKGTIDNATAHKIVETYRRENQAIVRFWSDIEKAFIYTAKYRKACELPRGLRFHAYQETGVTVTLPNERETYYPEVNIEYDQQFNRDSIRIYNALEHKYDHCWGGTLVENVVQAISRDILAEGMLRLEDAGRHTALSIHDELVIVVPKDQADGCLKQAIKELAVTPSWAPGLPLAAEGIISERYRLH